MFTVKLYKGHVSKIIEAESISVFPAGARHGSDKQPSLRTNRVREIQLTIGQDRPVFYVGEQGADVEGYAPKDAPYLYDVAFIENSRGATTETVRPY